MWYLLLCLVGLVIVCYVLWNMSKTMNKQEKFTTEYALCKSKGFSKEYCVRRFNPGVGLTPDNVIGKTISGSLGEVAVF